jgi:eukaryotic-like serine/threonine-protein kinase
MDDTNQPLDPSLPLSAALSIDQICDRFDQAIYEAIQSGRPWPNSEEYLGEAVEPIRSELRKELQAVEASYRQQQDSGRDPAAPGPAPPRTDPHPEQTEVLDPGERPGVVIAGRYKLLEMIGEGGMGTVWAAAQTQPVRRKVALKLIKAGMDSRSVVARFEAERQALAVMDHPNIAKVFDGGLTGTGRPFFVMEYVKGVPLSEYCETARLNIPQRLQLFVNVCQAVQHAHQKGVIHRDLKPSNILVTLLEDKPVPKVIDFGLAKAMYQPLTERTLHTAQEMVLGTAMYMSPEQAQVNNFDVDTRSDLYSLGVVLYELLTGTTPLEKQRFKEAAWDEVRRIIREEEPPRPSTRLSSSEMLPSLAAGRQMDPARLTSLVRGELDWIVMKALEKDRTRRYATANGLALDVERYLAGEPVLAAPPSARYRMAKFVRKHRAAITTAAAMLLLLLAGVVVSTWQAVRATRAEGRAETGETLANERLIQVDAEKKKVEEEKRIAQSVRDFLQHKLLGQADSRVQANSLMQSGGLSVEAKADPTIRELLDRAAKELSPETIEANFPGQPLVQAEILQTVGNTYRGVGESEKGITLLERSTALYRQQRGPYDRDTLTSMNNLAMTYFMAGRRDQARSLFEETLRLRKAHFPPDDPETFQSMSNLAWAQQESGKLELAIPLCKETLELQKANLGSDHPDTFTSMNNLAMAYHAAGMQDLALSLFKETLRLRRKYLPPDHPDTLLSMNNLGWAYNEAGQPELAESLFKETLELQRAKLGTHNSETLTSMNNLAIAYQASGKRDLAMSLFKETLELRIKYLPPNHPDTLVSMLNLADAYRTAEKLDLALPLSEETLALMKAKLPPNHPSTLTAMNNLGLVYLAAGKPDKAITVFEQTLLLRKKYLGVDHPDTLVTMQNLAMAYQNAGKPLLAIPLCRETLDLMKKKLPPNHPRTLTSMNNLARACQAAGRLDLALPLFQETLKLRQAHLPPDHPETLVSMVNLGNAYREHGEPNLAIPLLEKAVAIMTVKNPPAHSDTLSGMNNLGVAYLATGKLDLAQPLLEETLKLRRKSIGSAHPDTLVSILNLGMEYTAAGKPDLAAPLFKEAYPATKNAPALSWVGMRLLEALAQSGKTSEAVALAKDVLEDVHAQFPKDSLQLAAQLAPIGLSLLQAKAFTEAETVLRECLAIREKKQADEWTTFGTKSMLGGALLGQKKLAAAEPLLLAGYDGLKQREAKIPPQGKVRLVEALERLLKLNEALDKKDDAAKWRRELDAAKAKLPAHP